MMLIPPLPLFYCVAGSRVKRVCPANEERRSRQIFSGHARNQSLILVRNIYLPQPGMVAFRGMVASFASTSTMSIEADSLDALDIGFSKGTLSRNRRAQLPLFGQELHRDSHATPALGLR
eukprot:scaffold768_cov166-Amphora_coffeaeformis.AAC.30